MKFSIVTPSYNQLEFLKLCAASVADQRGKFDHEHLIQNGHVSPEFETWAQAQRFAEIVTGPDAGMYDAINKGFLRADGDVLSWLNCDEQYLPGALENAARWFEDHPEHDILFGDVILVNGDGEPLAYRTAVSPLRPHLRSCFLSTFSAATFVRRRVIDANYLLDTRFRAISDAVWVDKLLEAGFRAGVLNLPLATFTQTGANLGQSAVSTSEAKIWKKECGADGTARQLFWSICHRFRKMLHRAYQLRDVQIDVYVSGEPKRVTKRRIVGGRWKSSLQSASSSFSS
jgi:glycosyltransferase involved in cell wall biosynthesis